MNRAITTAVSIFLILICTLTSSAQSTQLIAKESTWTYLDDGSNQGTTWRDSGFVTTGWSTGQGPLGMGGITGATMNTTITRRVTTYYRKEFTLIDPAFSTLYLELMCDDGAIVFINGNEVLRDNLHSGTITFTTTASGTISGSNEGDYELFSIPASYLVDGVNTVAVELHNRSTTSSDLAFDLSLDAIDLGDFLLQRLDTWSYNDSGIDQGTAWYSTAFDASLWPTGNAVLGYGGITGAAISTTLEYGPSISNKYPTAYFHKEVYLDNPNYAILEIGLLADDGAAVYINGKLAFTQHMNSTWDYSSYANSTVGGADEGDYDLFTVPDTFLVNGRNVFSVEVHQTNASSSDLAFDMEIIGKRGRVIHGELFMDMDGNGMLSGYDVFGSGAVEIRMYDDADSNGILLESEVVNSKLTNAYGKYSAFVDEQVRHLAVRLMTEDLDTRSEVTTDSLYTFTLSSSNLDSVEVNFGQLGPRSLCLLVADDQGNDDKYYVANRISGKNAFISTMETDEIEAIAIRIGMDSVWAFDDGQFGSMDILTGSFTAIGTGIGSGTGLRGGVSTTYAFTDVDGLAYDGQNDVLYGVERVSGSNDLLIAVNRSTGDLEHDFFGTGVDFIEVVGTGIKQDIDDIAFNPTTGLLLAVNNENSGDSTRYISIDPATGAGTVISIVGVGDFESLGYYNTGELYGTTGEETKDGYYGNTFFSIDRLTGIGTALDSLYSGAIDVEACDCLTGPIENLISGSVFYDADSSGSYNPTIDSSYGNIEVYLYQDINENGVADSGDILLDSTLTDINTGFYVFIIDSIGNYVTTPNIALTALETMNITTDSSLMEIEVFTLLGTFDGQNDFGFHQTSGVPYLPVEWLEINAEWTEHQNAAVTWSTASEKNNSHFEVERLNETGDYEYIGTVQAAGNSQSISDYSFVDFDAPYINMSTLVYRVKQVDINGESDYSPKVTLERTMKNTIDVKAYPNPITEYVNVSIAKKGNYVLELMDMSGTLIVQKSGTQYESFSPIRIGELNLLPPGVYLLRVTCDREEKVIKLIK